MNQKSYLQCTIRVSNDLHELLAADLFSLGCDGVEEREGELVVFMPLDRSKEEVLESVQAIVAQYEGKVTDVLRQDPQNWNEAWEKSIQPIYVHPFFIRPTWYKGEIPADVTQLYIDPKMSFGTGYHETTRLMLSAIPRYVKPGDAVLDVGTGTGILAIAALKAGAGEAFGFDIDEWSYENAMENMHRNHVQERMRVAEGSFETVPASAKFDMILANVHRSALLEMAQRLTSSLHTGGYLLLSGLLQHEEAYIQQNEYFSALTFVGKNQEGEWISLVYKT